MKTVILCLIGISAFGQNIFMDSIAGSIGTTDLEYNYATKGYKTSLAEGLDIKKGYFVKTIGSIQDGQRYYFEYRGLFREQTKQLACVILYAKSKAWNNEYYLCIPLNNGTLQQKFNQDLVKWDSAMLGAYAYFASLNYSVIAK